MSSTNHTHPRYEIPINSWDHQTIRREQASQIMDGDLKPWGLHSLDGAEQPESLESMKNLITRYRTARVKGTDHTYTEDALKRSCCAFIRRWNTSRREVTSFTTWIERREDTHGVHAIGDLRRIICRLTRDEFHMCCIHICEQCTTCYRERPTPI